MTFKMYNNHQSVNLDIDKRNKRLVVNCYPREINPLELSDTLVQYAKSRQLEKIWVWALPSDVQKFLHKGFKVEGTLNDAQEHEFVVSLAHYVHEPRGYSDKVSEEDCILHEIMYKPIGSLPNLPREFTLKYLDEIHAPQISELMSQVFTSYPSPIEKPEYIRSLLSKGNLFAGAFFREQLVSVAAAYPDPILNRCEMTDCATLNEYRGYSLTERLLRQLGEEIKNQGPLQLYSLARAQSLSMNRVFYKLGYQYQGRLIKNCHIAGSFEDMNLWTLSSNVS